MKANEKGDTKAPGSAELEPAAKAAQAVSAPAAGSRFFNRELSWLDFNERVLALAEDAARPPLERAKFLAIFSRNLDEFFQIRVSGLREQAVAGVRGTSAEGMSPREQLRAIRSRVEELVVRQTQVFENDVRPRLDAGGVKIVNWDDLKKSQREALSQVFEERVFPVLTPLAVDPSHPFPYISDLSLNLAVLVRDQATGTRRFARVKIPPLLPRFLKVPGGRRFVPLEQVIAAHLDWLFPGTKVTAHHPFRVTRDADVEVEVDEAGDLLETLETLLHGRRRTPEAVRLEVTASLPQDLRSLLLRELRLTRTDLYEIDGLLDLADLWPLTELKRPALKEKPWTGVTPPRLATPRGEPFDVFDALRQGDVLVHHPYDLFTTSVEALVDQAADDPNVLAIKQTIYRTSDEGEAPIVRSLIRAAAAGKETVALVELTARGDEEANIAWARALEKAGVHVVYGVVGLKTHAKTVLVVRREESSIQRYCHIGTGNYNPETATVYEDLGLLSADQELTADVADLFNSLTGYSSATDYRKILVAPGTLRSRLLEFIRGEASPEGRIVMKMNSLADPEMIDALYEASTAGAAIDLIVRGICCLRPGVKGLSETIRVRSIVGSYLEHSRIFRFGSDASGPRYWIGSADLMPRNLGSRVECVAPVIDPEITSRLEEILLVNLADDMLAWELAPDGWTKVPTKIGIDAHARLRELAEARVLRSG
ncbi:MAG: polyphosphate kinase 1 [Candidatus Rokuibacteriota bacterium]|nr:MAG: polyphosphate kinase 1 [Candidatus Rokubacteria bacterium]